MSSKAGLHASKNVVSDDKLINITDASKYLHTSRNTTWRVIKHNKIKTFENPLDLRETLVCKDDLDYIKIILRPKKNRRRAKSK
jgi:predicted DNA-binding transcriptional regulator AlpA